MATRSEIESKLAANEAKRNALAAKIGPAQDEAQQAYNTWQFFKSSRENGATYGPSWTGTLNGVTYTDPDAFLQAAETDFNTKRDIRKELAVEFNSLFPEKEQLEQQLETAEDPTATIKTPEATNESQSDAATDEKYSDTNNTPDEDPFEESRKEAEDRYNALDNEDSAEATREIRSGVPIGAERGRNITKASAEWAETKDLRVIIRVPKTYLKGPAAGPSGMLNNFGGILFPYTPTISYDTQAVYGSVNPVHSNYTQYFYKNSQVGQINISGKFTVQNEKEGKVWLGVVHLLRGLTKMRWGSDSNAGSPPPVCRLEAYGDFMLRNVPVVISNFKFDLPDNVDYMAVKGEYKNTLVPTVSTLNVTLNVMYSRREMQDYSVDSWLQGNLRGQGYL